MLNRIDVSSRDNNFYLVRLLLASRVIFGHAFVLAGASVAAGEQSFGRIYNSLGVNGFFVVSGFLVTRSLLSSKSWRDYVYARVLRILPALWVMIWIMTPIVVLLGVDNPPPGWETIRSAFIYVIRNMLILPITYDITGVFSDMPYPAINGSLWSLRFEVICYVLLAGLALLSVRRLSWLMPVIAVLLYAGLAYVSWSGDAHYFVSRFLRLGSLFFFGAALALHAERIFVSVPLGLLLVLVSGAIGYWTGLTHLMYFPFGYLVLSLAYSDAPVLKRVRRAIELKSLGAPDLSYGIYLYSFPIQQLLYFHRITPDPYSNIALTIVIAGCCAWFSSQFIEKPASRLRHLFTLGAARTA